jgi:aldose 1-epimerase
VTSAVQLVDESIEIDILPELGARLHALRAFGRDVLRTPADPTEHVRQPFFWGAYHMAPWCNRIAAQTETVAGKQVTPEPNFSDGTAIHGRVYLRPTTRVGEGSFRMDDAGDAGWPWAYSFQADVAAEGARLRVRQSVINHSDSVMPAGLGFHPWFIRPVEVSINAGSVYPSNSSSASEAEVVSGDLDQRRLRPLAEGIDATWTDVADPPVRLLWRDLRIGATVTFKAAARHVVGAAPPDIAATAIEAQTHAPDGLRRLLAGEPGALTMLQPGAELSLEIALEFEQISPGGAP